MIGTAALLLLTAFDPAAALAHWEQATVADPSCVTPHLHRARLLLGLDRLTEAREAVDTAARLSVRAVVTVSATSSGAPLASPKWFVPSLPATPQPEQLPSAVLSVRADLAITTGRWEEAAADLGELVKRRADADAHRRYGRVLLAVNYLAEAEAEFDAVLVGQPDDPVARAGLAHARAAQGKPVADPLTPAARGYQHLRGGDPTAALPHLLEALAAEPRSFALLYATSLTAGEADRPMVSVALFSATLQLPLTAEVQASAFICRGRAWLQAGCPPAAEQDADRAIALHPQDPDAHDQLGRIAETRGDARAAVGHYAAALERKPTHPNARGRLAILKAVGPDPALRDPAGATELAEGMPDGPQRHAVLAMAHAAAGRFGRAVIAVNAALSTGPPADDVPQLKAMRAAYLRDRPWPDGD